MVTWRDDKVGDYTTDHYSELELVMQKGGRAKPKLSRQQLQSKSVSELKQIKDGLQGNCSEERQMLESLSGLSLEQILAKLNGYLSNHEPCLQTTPTFHDGGSSSRNHCDNACGDLTGDGDVNILDIVALINIVLGEDYNPCGDVNGDGSVDVLDIVALVGAVLDDYELTGCPAWPDPDDFSSTMAHSTTGPGGNDLCQNCGGGELQSYGHGAYTEDPRWCCAVKDPDEDYTVQEAVDHIEDYIAILNTDCDYDYYPGPYGYQLGYDCYKHTPPHVEDGCMDPAACNYDSDATFDDGSCIFPEEYYDCDGNCIGFTCWDETCVEAEADCPIPECEEDEFDCLGDGTECIPDGWTCTGECNCTNCADEDNCACSGIIGCDDVCYEDIIQVTFLPPAARYNRCGCCGDICGSLSLDCNNISGCAGGATSNDCCSIYGDAGSCDMTFENYVQDVTDINELGDTIVILGPAETTPCSWDYGEEPQVCMYAGSGETGGKVSQLKKGGITKLSRQQLQSKSITELQQIKSQLQKPKPLPKQKKPKPLRKQKKLPPITLDMPPGWSYYETMGDRIIGGYPVDPPNPNTYPFYTALVHESQDDTARACCGGSLIDPEWVLTAGHCCDLCMGSVLTSGWTAHVGAHYYNEDTIGDEIIEFDAMVIHPGYYGSWAGMPGDWVDACLLHLSSPSTLTPIEMNRDIALELDGTSIQAIGLGLTVPYNPSDPIPDYISPDELMEAEIHMNESCGNWPSIGYIGQYEICAGQTGGDTSNCNGDSGGPNINLEFNRLVGITSWGPTGCEPGNNLPSVYCSVNSIVDWVDDILNCESEIDCHGTCGGDAVRDECGVCNGDCNTYCVSPADRSHPNYYCGIDLDVLQDFVDENCEGNPKIDCDIDIIAAASDVNYELWNPVDRGYWGGGGRLIQLNAQWINLTSVPDSIENLSHLRVCKLWTNDLTSLPESIGNLSNLENIDLYNNQLTTLPELCNLPDDCDIRVDQNNLCEEYHYYCINPEYWLPQDCVSCNDPYDECGVCGGDGPSEECWDGSMVCDADDCPGGGECIEENPDMVTSPYDCDDWMSNFGYSCNTMICNCGADICWQCCTGCDAEYASGCPDTIEGCTDMDACNYNPDATEDDGSCVQPEENYDCDGNCLTDPDCSGECGGSAVVDECGVCGGDGSSCACTDVVGVGTSNMTCGDGSCSQVEAVHSCRCKINGELTAECECTCNFADAEHCDGEHPGYTLTVPESDGNGIVYSCIEHESCNVYGCTNFDACNYNPDANSDDGSCTYPEENFDCDGNCIIDVDCYSVCGGDAVEDCAGVCEGTSVVDECGVCDGDGSSCGGVPGKFDCRRGGDNWPQCMKQQQIVRRSGGFTKPKFLSKMQKGGSTQQNCPVGFTLAADGSCIPG